MDIDLAVTVGEEASSEKLTLTDPALKTPPASGKNKDLRRRHKAINSQIKIPSSCCPIQCGNHSMDEWISNRVNRFTTSWLLTTSLPKEKSMCFYIKQGQSCDATWTERNASLRSCYELYPFCLPLIDNPSHTHAWRNVKKGQIKFWYHIGTVSGESDLYSCTW